MTADLWAQLDTDGTATGADQPFFTLNLEDEDATLLWLNTELDRLKAQARERVVNQRKNLAHFRGIRYQQLSQRERTESVDATASRKDAKNPRVIYNHLVDMVEQDVARLCRYRGAINAVPPSDDNDDRITATVTEELIEGFWDKVDIDHLMQKHARRKRILGEDVVGVFWNKNLGPYDPAWIRAIFKATKTDGDPDKMPAGELALKLRKILAKKPRLPVVDESGEQIKDQAGRPLWIDHPVRLGDVEYKLIFSWDSFFQRKDEETEVEYWFWRERVAVEKVKAQHPSKASKIQADSPDWKVYDPESCEDQNRGGEVEVVHFYHRSTDELDQGRYVKFTRTALLINRENPYRGWDDKAILPCARTLDIETPAVLNGDATMTFGRQCQSVYNNLISMELRNRFLFSHPKWMVPNNAVATEKLSNGATVVHYKGPTPPALAQPNLFDASSKEAKADAKGDMQQIMNVQGVSRGEPPPGVSAYVALAFMDDQEMQRAELGIAAHTRTLKNVATQTAWLMADHYRDDEGRLERILGKNKAAYASKFRMANIRSIADFRIQNGSALPQQKTTKMQMIVEMKQNFPMLIPDEVAADVMGLAEIKRLRNAITVAIQKAENENDAMMNGAAVADPLDAEFHIAHYRCHVRQMNEQSFATLDPEAKQCFEDHTAAHEMFLVKWCENDPQQLIRIRAEWPGFPLFFVPQQPLPAMPMMPPAGPSPQGALPPVGMPADPMTEMATPPVEAMPAPGGAIPGGAEAQTPL